MATDSASRSGLSVALRVRPARIGVLVPRLPGVSWPKLFELALAAQSRTWGGTGHLVFPLPQDLTDRELFWELGDRLDADSWTVYAPTYGDMESLHPTWHREHQRQLDVSLSEYSQDVREQYLADHRTNIYAEVRPSGKQAERIKRRLAPLHHEGQGPSAVELTTALWEPRWPFVDITAFRDLPATVRNPRSPLGGVFGLLLTAEVGRLSSGFGAALTQLGVSVVEEELKTPAQWAQFLFSTSRDTATAYPWTLSEHGLAWYLSDPAVRERVTLVVGDAPWDFALFYALRRWTSLAFWLPSWLERNALYAQLLRGALEQGSRTTGQPVAVVTTGRSTRRRDRMVADLRRLTLRVEACHWRDVLPDEPNRLFEQGGAGRAQHVPLMGDVTAPLPTPLPRTVSCHEPSEMRWMTDVVVDGWSPLRHPKIGTAVVHAQGYGTELVRTTRTGVSYFCPHFFYVGGASLESITIRPRLQPLRLLDEIRLLAADSGWRVDLSDKGIYAAETVRLFGSRQAVASTLREPALAATLDAYLSRHDAGVKLSDGRRYLSALHIERDVLGSQAEARRVLEELGRKGVLARGLILRCQRCRHTAWYALGDVGAEFRCARCRLEQGVEGHWRGELEPVWYYQLAEVVYQFLTHNGDLPLLAVEDRFAAARQPVDDSNELKFVNEESGTEFELDLAVSEGCRLWLGEASTTGRFEPGTRLKQLRRAAVGLDAYGVLIVTSRSGLRVSTTEALDKVFRPNWPTVELITAVQVRP